MVTITPPMLFLDYAANLAEKQQIPIYWSLVWSDRGSNPRSTAFKASMLTITPPMRFEQIVTEHISVKLKQINISKRILMQSLTINRWNDMVTLHYILWVYKIIIYMYCDTRCQICILRCHFTYFIISSWVCKIIIYMYYDKRCQICILRCHFTYFIISSWACKIIAHMYYDTRC